ncbi:hypothetical protein [Alkalihalobacillus sp. BA299]|uniref:hypothetical protein n=1 Tax=Alkalihalobacillus sp. BA299 TaxID=2815938 RepID=UPI001ADD3CBB|nr:hypothetical protein [Alkalihalobacillus sp. BA299]
MLRLILFAFIGFYILTGTNFGKSLMEEHNFFEEGSGIKSVTEKLIGNEATKQEMQEVHDTNEPTLSQDEAVTKILTAFSMTELLTMLEKVKDGLTDEDIAEMKATLKERLPAEDIEALKQLGKDEFNKYFNHTKK